MTSNLKYDYEDHSIRSIFAHCLYYSLSCYCHQIAPEDDRHWEGAESQQGEQCRLLPMSQELVERVARLEIGGRFSEKNNTDK